MGVLKVQVLYSKQLRATGMSYKIAWHYIIFIIGGIQVWKQSGVENWNTVNVAI